MLIASLGALLPRPARTASEGPPRVDLSHVSLRDGRLLAPTLEGGTATLTLDPHLQHAATRLLGRAQPVEGAAVVIDVKRGRLLAAAEYTKNGRASGAVLTTARAPAASLFKIVTTAALLGRYVRPDRPVCFESALRRIEPSHLQPATGPEARCSPFRNALGYSRNAVYAQLATRVLDPPQLLETAERLGFNGPVPSDLPATVGTLALPEERLAFARAAAGFGGSRLSPLGAAHLAYVVALRGNAARMRIVDRAEAFQAPQKREDVGRVMNESVAVELRRMMEVTVHSGTSLEAFTNAEGRSYLGDIRVAGKTGTLQDGDHQPTTTWFTGFAPSRTPEIVVTVLLNNGPVWHQKANEVARDLLRAYFHGKKRRGVTDPFETVEPRRGG
jgi:penicillin-binding protein A